MLRAVENVKNWRDLGQRLRVPRSKVVEIDKLYSTDKEKMKAVVEYWWRVDPSPSWRMVIRALDWADETDAADRIKPNAERLAGNLSMFVTDRIASFTFIPACSNRIIISTCMAKYLPS